MNCASIQNDHEIVGAAVAMKAADLAKAWGTTTVRFEAGHRDASFLVHVETEDGRYIRATLPSAPETLLFDLEINSSREVIKQSSCSIEHLDEIVKRLSFSASSQPDQCAVKDGELSEWDEYLWEPQPRSPFIKLLRSLS